MQCRRCAGHRSLQVPKNWWQIAIPYTVRFQCTICDRPTLRLALPMQLRIWKRQLSEALHAAPVSLKLRWASELVRHLRVRGNTSRAAAEVVPQPGRAGACAPPGQLSGRSAGRHTPVPLEQRAWLPEVGRCASNSIMIGLSPPGLQQQGRELDRTCPSTLSSSPGSNGFSRCSSKPASVVCLRTELSP